MELKKSYRGFVIWMVIFLPALFSPALLPGELAEPALIIRLLFVLCTTGITILTFIINKTEYIYWYSGMYYKQAAKAGSRRRKAYARAHFKRFAGFTLFHLLFTVAAHALHLHFGVDIAVFMVGLVSTAVSTIKIKL